MTTEEKIEIVVGLKKQVKNLEVKKETDLLVLTNQINSLNTQISTLESEIASSQNSASVNVDTSSQSSGAPDSASSNS